MILGTYWYFAFPTDLYKFDFFEFKKGYGGHVDNPAELVASFETAHPGKIIDDLKELIDRYPEGTLFICQENNKLRIGTAGHQLFDYDFLIITEVEKLLKNHKAYLIKDEGFSNPAITRICNKTDQDKIIYPKKGFLQVVGSDLKKHNAENVKLRLDCHLELADKDKFVNELKAVATEEQIDVFFYYDQDFNDKTNLMLFFTNGRQGLHLAKKKFIDTARMEEKIEKIALANKVEFGHISGAGLYPQNGPKIEMMIEQEFIL